MVTQIWWPKWKSGNGPRWPGKSGMAPAGFLSPPSPPLCAQRLHRPGNPDAAHNKLPAGKLRSRAATASAPIDERRRAFRQDRDDPVPNSGTGPVRHDACQTRTCLGLAERTCPIGAVQFAGNDLFRCQRNPQLKTIPKFRVPSDRIFRQPLSINMFEITLKKQRPDAPTEREKCPAMAQHARSAMAWMKRVKHPWREPARVTQSVVGSPA